MSISRPRILNVKLFALLIMVSLLIVGPFSILKAYGADLGDRSVLLSDNTPSATSIYGFTFNTTSSANLGSIVFTFCSDSPLPNTPCAAPVGLSVVSANLDSQTGDVGFGYSIPTQDNRIIITRTSSPATPIQSTYTFSGITNPSAAGDYYIRIQTYSSVDGSGGETDEGGLAYAISPPFEVQATVPPYLYFCSGQTITNSDCNTATGSYVDFGELSPTESSTGQTQLLAASNAQTGYTITVGGTTMTAGNDIIPEIDTQDVSRPGTSQFGINLRANSSPSIGEDPSGPGLGEPVAEYDIANKYKFTPGDVIAATNAPDQHREYTVSYLVNVDKNQDPGIYVSTITYICLASF